MMQRFEPHFQARRDASPFVNSVRSYKIGSDASPHLQNECGRIWKHRRRRNGTRQAVAAQGIGRLVFVPYWNGRFIRKIGSMGGGPGE